MPVIIDQVTIEVPEAGAATGPSAADPAALQALPGGRPELAEQLVELLHLLRERQERLRAD